MRIGHPNGAQVGYVKTVFFKSQEEIDNHATQEGAGLGRIRWRDLDSNGIINEKDQQWIFDPTPAFSFGINIYLEYKNFDLTMFWQGVQGVDIISDLKKETDLWSGLNIGFLNKGKRVLMPGRPPIQVPTFRHLHVTTVTTKTRIYLLCGERLLPETTQSASRLQHTESMDRENPHGAPALLPQCTKSAHHQEQRFQPE